MWVPRTLSSLSTFFFARACLSPSGPRGARAYGRAALRSDFLPPSLDASSGGSDPASLPVLWLWWYGEKIVSCPSTEKKCLLWPVIVIKGGWR